MELFQERGFDGTSMNEVVEYTGVCRASLYKKFGNKEALYAKALEAYRDQAGESLQQLLDAPGSVQERLRNLFYHQIHSIVEEANPGCMVVRSATEIKGHPDLVLNQLRDNEAQSRAIFRKLIEEGQRAGEIKPSLPSASLAQLLYTYLQGLTVNSLIQSGSSSLETATDQFLQLLFQSE